MDQELSPGVSEHLDIMKEGKDEIVPVNWNSEGQDEVLKNKSNVK